MIPTMGELTKDVQVLAGRDDTLRLIRRSGEVALASKQTVPPVAVLFVFFERLEKGRKAVNLLDTPMNKMIKLARTAYNKHLAEEQAAEAAVLEAKKKALLAKFSEPQPEAPAE